MTLKIHALKITEMRLEMQIPPGKVEIYAFQATKRSFRHQNLCSLPERIVILKR